jgi:F-type H+-transporting ATPase subunit delta|tara:strand:- start:232 stop:705 length:474 start_codon:yes stop_codon:yes gene_type:complete
LDVVEGNVKEFLNIYETSENLKNFIKNPTQPQSNQLNVLNKISTQMNISKVTKNFLNVLVLKRRIFFINKIFLNFLSLASKKRGELKVSLISSKNMTIGEIENLNKDLSQTLGATIALDFKVDENLIGGLTMKIGSLMIDTSIKNKLKKYEKTMLEI